MISVKHFKRFVPLFLILSSFLIMAYMMPLNQMIPDPEGVKNIDIRLNNAGENVTYVTIPLTINIVNGTDISLEEIHKNIEELNEIFKNNSLGQPSAIFMWDYQIHVIADPEGDDDGVIEYAAESRDRVRAAAEDSAQGKGMSITVCNSAGQPDLTAITNIGESHGIILTVGTDGSDWAHELQHALGFDHGPVEEADEDMDGDGDIDFYDRGNDADGNGAIERADRNYNLWGIKRTRLYNGQFLTASDFDIEQTYHTSMRRLGNNFFHGWGVVSGLGVHDNRSDTLNSTSGLVEEKSCVDLISSKIRVNITTKELALEFYWAHKLVAPIEDNCSYDLCIDNKSSAGDPNPGLYFGADLMFRLSRSAGFLEGSVWRWLEPFGIWEELAFPLSVNPEAEVIETTNYYNDTGSGYVAGIPPSLISASITDPVFLDLLGIASLATGEYQVWGVSRCNSTNVSKYIYDQTEKETVVDLQQPQPLLQSLTPASVAAGSNLTLNATGFPPNANLTLRVGGQNLTLQANATGNVNANVTVPSNLTSPLTIISVSAANATSIAGYFQTYSYIPRLDPITPNPSLTGVINLNWNDVINATLYYVYRNTSMISSVAGLPPLNTSSKSDYRDNVPNGTYYYAIVAFNGTANSTLSNCQNVTVTIPPPRPALTGKVFIYVNSGIYKSINASLVQFKADLQNVGYNVTLINYTAITSIGFFDAQQIKQQLIASYASGLEGVIFVGQMPFVNYEIYSVPFPCDLYFMDLDGQWNDWDGNLAYENHSAGMGNRDPEIWFGRIDASTMSGRTEVTALQQYFQRNHMYRTGLLTRPHSSLLYIDDDWSPWDTEWANSSVHAYTNQTVMANDNVTVDTDYESALTLSVEWVHLFVHSYFDKHIFKPFYTSGYTHWYEIRNINTAALFYLLYACTACDFSSTNNIGTEYLFSNNTLATLGCTRTGGMLEPSWFYDPLGNGSTLGEAFIRWFSDCTLPSAGLNNPANSYGMTLLGDPTLKILYGPLNTPPTLSPLTGNISSIHLQWSKVSDAALYYIYRNTSKITSTTGLSPIGWTTNNYTDDIVPGAGTYFYAVVAGNDFTNSSISNCENITVALSVPSAPQLYPIAPDPSTSGVINVNWSSVTGATSYYLFRDTTPSFPISGLSPIATGGASNYTDTISINGTYYYVVIATNTTGNSTLSNYENVTVSIPPSPIPSPPYLYAISPNISTTGTINLDWDDVTGATIYYIYRNGSQISTISGLNPIVTSPTSAYQDTINTDGTYYYVVVASNTVWNTSISNCQSVTVNLSTASGIPGFGFIVGIFALLAVELHYLRKKHSKI
jgi:hypothetical protein